MRLSRSEFAALVAEALDDLPEGIARFLDNVEVVVEDEPDPETVEEMGLGTDETLFGLYRGIPLTERTSNYGLVLPDQIVIYQLPLEWHCRSREEIREEVRRTVIHEIAHHFGISDDRLHELGWD